MSRGPGRMERMIVEALDESRRWMADVKTMRFGPFTKVWGRYRNHRPETDNSYIVRINGEVLCLRNEEFDLSATLQFLAQKQNRIHDDKVDLSFSNSFWRATKRLVETGYFTRVQEKSNRIILKTKKLSVGKDITGCNSANT